MCQPDKTKEKIKKIIEDESDSSLAASIIYQKLLEKLRHDRVNILRMAANNLGIDSRSRQIILEMANLTVR